MHYVSKKMVVALNKMVVELSGGTAMEDNIRPGQNLGFVEQISSNTLFGEKIYHSIFEQAAAYLFYIIKNHPFFDGNKRTALITAITFLEWNQILFSPLNEDQVFDFVMAVAGGDNQPDKIIPEVSKWLEQMSLT
jgi:death-on-curing protein